MHRETPLASSSNLRATDNPHCSPGKIYWSSPNQKSEQLNYGLIKRPARVLLSRNKVKVDGWIAGAPRQPHR